MSFLAPLFFAGLLGLAVPILVHLTHKERKDVVVFPSLMFLSRIPYQAVRKQRIRHWLLFALRCLALIFLALAFARPFLDRPAAAAPVRSLGAKELVILLDRSYSMRGQPGQQSGSGGASQRELADQAEQMARQLERLVRENPQSANNDKIEESARRLQDAANAMASTTVVARRLPPAASRQPPRSELEI